MKVKELFHLWLEKYAKLGVKMRTYNKYEFIVYIRIIPRFGDLELNQVTTISVQEFILNLMKSGNLKDNSPLSVNTVYGIISVLKQGFNLAIVLELINKNPVNAIKMPKTIEKEVYALSREEQKIIEQYCLHNKKWNYIGIILCLYTGIRLGELLALTWDDIDFENKSLCIKKTAYKCKSNGQNKMIIDTPKTKKSNRVIPLCDKLLNLLKLSEQYANSKYIISTKNGKIIETRAYQRTFESILKKCGIKHYNFHCLRHTFATRAIELGMNPKTLSEILGHTNVGITLNRYAHSLYEFKVQEMNKLSILL